MAKPEDKKPLPKTRFKLKDRVRVKYGVADNDYPDIPLGGWAGTIEEVQEDGMLDSFRDAGALQTERDSSQYS